MELIRQVEQKALAMRGQVPDADFASIDAAGPDTGLPMERLLYTPPFKADLRAAVVEQADATIVADALFEQVYVDQARLTGNLRRALQTRRQVSLAAVIAAYPIEQGLAELATYLKLATQDVAAMIDDERTESITWTGSDGRQRQAILPMVIFTLRDTNHEE